MSRKRDPFALALDSLRTRAEEGIYAPGAPVIIIEEARRLNLSTTPVREALCWLCGYGLMERAPMGGFLAPRLDPAVVRDRLAFRLQCLATGVNGASQEHRAHGHGLAAQITRLGLSEHMLRTVQGTGNAALIDAYQRVNRQLVQLRPAERRLFTDLDEEAEALVRLFEAAPGTGLPEAIAAYHRRRIDAAPLLVVEAGAGRDLPENEA